jgi:peptidoglycan hydrolase CwlO-like protein
LASDKVRALIDEAFLYWAAIPLALIAILLAIFGVSTYKDFTSKVDASEKQVEVVSAAALSDLQRMAADIKRQYGQLQSDVSRYRQVNEKIAEVQKQLMAVRAQIVDLGNSTVRAGAFESTGRAGPSSWSLNQLGCGPSALAKGYEVAEALFT